MELCSDSEVGDELEGGDVLGTVQETIVVTQKIMVPPNMKGTLKEINPANSQWMRRLRFFQLQMGTRS